MWCRMRNTCRNNPLDQLCIRFFVILSLYSFFFTPDTNASSLVFSTPRIARHDVPVGVADSIQFHIINTSDDTLRVVSIGISGSSPYDTISFNPKAAIIAPADSCRVNMRIVATVRMMMQDYIGVELADGQFFYLPLVLQSVGYLDCYPQALNRSHHEQGIMITGTRLKDVWDADKRIVPDAGIVFRAVIACRDSLQLGVRSNINTPVGFYWILFEKDGVRLDSLLLEIAPSSPHIWSPFDKLSFGPQKILDTLEVRGRDFWPGCRFEFLLDGLSVVSTELSSDTLATLLVRLDGNIISTNSVIRVVNPDSGRSIDDASVYVYFEEPPLGLENDNTGPGAQLPRAFSLGSNCPNPFNPSTTISYSVAGNAPVRVVLRVFNLRGQNVATLADRLTAPGEYSVEWDGTDSGGAKLSSGVYFYRMTAGEFSFTRKMVLLK